MKHTTGFTFANVSWAEHQMISEGLWDTEDWRNSAETSALITEIHYILKCIQIRKQLLETNNNIPKYYWF